MPLPRLVGRDRELELVRAFVTEVAERGGALLLSGEAGVGKSVLLDVAVAQAQAAGTWALRAGGAQWLASGVRRRLLAQALGNPLVLLELPLTLSGGQRRAGSALPTVLTRALTPLAYKLARKPGSCQLERHRRP